jgi:hypothetical protein
MSSEFRGIFIFLGIFKLVSTMLIAIILGTIILLTTKNFAIAVSVAIAILMISERESNEGD